MQNKLTSLSLAQANQKGFTLIELVVVIVLLGILAVTAAPRFIDVQDDARTATLNAIKASMESASTLVYSKALIAGNETLAASTVQVNGVDVLIQFGYPVDAGAAGEANWRDDLLDLNPDEFTVDLQNNGIIVRPTDNTAALAGAWPADIGNPAADERNCFVQYRESDVVGDRPLILEVSPCI